MQEQMDQDQYNYDSQADSEELQYDTETDGEKTNDKQYQN